MAGEQKCQLEATPFYFRFAVLEDFETEKQKPHSHIAPVSQSSSFAVSDASPLLSVSQSLRIQRTDYDRYLLPVHTPSVKQRVPQVSFGS